MAFVYAVLFTWRLVWIVLTFSLRKSPVLGSSAHTCVCSPRSVSSPKLCMCVCVTRWDHIGNCLLALILFSSISKAFVQSFSHSFGSAEDQSGVFWRVLGVAILGRALLAFCSWWVQASAPCAALTSEGELIHWGVEGAWIPARAPLICCCGQIYWIFWISSSYCHW